MPQCFRTLALTAVAALASLAVSPVVRAESPPVIWFEVGEIETDRDQSFLVPLSDPEHIANARALIANGGRPSDDLPGILLARIEAGGDGFNRDIRDPGQRLWRWHIAEVDGFGGLAIELCDGWPAWIEEHPEAFIRNTSGAICLWGYTVKSELAEPPAFAIGEGIDGAWFDPAMPGQGVYVDVLGDSGQLAFAWFTWGEGAEVGEKLWLTGLGPIEGARVEAQVFNSEGGGFLSNRPVESTPIGTAALEFDNCNRARMRVSLQGRAPAEIPLQRVVPRAGCMR
ncbi:MAG: hypothetical protein MEQ07_09870 [Aquimonas sp.]|nr:hypothetical protein [Aquimonas sp.]